MFTRLIVEINSILFYFCRLNEEWNAWRHSRRLLEAPCWSCNKELLLVTSSTLSATRAAMGGVVMLQKQLHWRVNITIHHVGTITYTYFSKYSKQNEIPTRKQSLILVRFKCEAPQLICMLNPMVFLKIFYDHY